MSQTSVAGVKRSKPITAWLKKEYQEVKESNESNNKLFKLSPKVSLEPFDVNFIKKALNVIESGIKTDNLVSDKPIKTQNSKYKKKTENKVQTQGLRRSARNLPPDQKPIENPVEREPDIKDLPSIIFKGHINYIHEFHDIASLCDKLLTDIENNKNNIVPVGFDLEWPFNFQTGSGKTALAQICLNEKECHLLHLYRIKKLPTSFILFMSHPKVKLVGVNIKNDVWKLTRDFKEFPGQKVVDNNCLDCGPYVNSVIGRSCRWSLERLTAYLLRKKISKNPSVRNSKWHIHPLSTEQKLYAATDAYVSLLLHLTIEQKEIELLAEQALKEQMEKHEY